MNLSIEIQINDYEQRLKQAMLQSDVLALDELLASDLIFTNHLGQLTSKQDDLDAHQSGGVQINEITFSDQTIKIVGSVVAVSVKTHISGSFGGMLSENDFRFTRIWSKTSSNNWQVIIAHSTIVN